MARIVNSTLLGGRGMALTPQQRRQAERKLARLAQKNPLRVVRVDCHGPLRDAVAQVGDHVWCEKCKDHVPVVSVRE